MMIINGIELFLTDWSDLKVEILISAFVMGIYDWHIRGMHVGRFCKYIQIQSTV